jgi:hypothetical protein
VKERLERLVDALARRPGLSGVAFADWKPVTGSSYDSTLTVPPLGFAPPERLATLDAIGWDPVDAPIADPPFVPAGPTMGIDLQYAGPINPQGRYRTLVTGLVARAEAGRKGWTTYRLDGMPEPPHQPGVHAELSAPDRVASVPTFTGAAPEVVLLPIPSREDLAASHAPEALRPLKPIEVVCLPGLRRNLGLDHARAIVYDFRACPEDITASLDWLYPKAAVQKE